MHTFLRLWLLQTRLCQKITKTWFFCLIMFWSIKSNFLSLKLLVLLGHNMKRCALLFFGKPLPNSFVSKLQRKIWTYRLKFYLRHNIQKGVSSPPSIFIMIYNKFSIWTAPTYRWDLYSHVFVGPLKYEGFGGFV